MGEVLHRNGDVFGDAVNTAARIESVAEGGQVMFSDTVFSAMNQNEVPVVHLGLKQLKGLKFPIRLWRVRTRQDELRAQRERLRRLVRQSFAIGIAAVFIVVIVWLAWQLFGPVPALDNATAAAQSI